MLLQGVCIKFATLFIIIPDPIVGGIFCVMFGMITAFGKKYFYLHNFMKNTYLFSSIKPF